MSLSNALSKRSESNGLSGLAPCNRLRTRRLATIAGERVYPARTLTCLHAHRSNTRITTKSMNYSQRLRSLIASNEALVTRPNEVDTD